MARTPQELFASHVGAVHSGDPDTIVADYTDDAVFITPDGVRHGKDGVRAGFAALLAELPAAQWDSAFRVFDGDVLLVGWSAVAATTRALDGVHTFVFAGDGIRAQTVRYTLATATRWRRCRPAGTCP